MFFSFLSPVFSAGSSDSKVAIAAQTRGLPDDYSPNILVIHSYRPSYVWTSRLNESIVETLYKRFPTAVVHVEYLGGKRFLSPDLLDAYSKIIELKYEGKEPDVVILCDDDALGFIIQKCPPSLRDVPMIFCGVNDYSLASPLPSDMQIMGLVEEPEADSSIELVRLLHPDRSTVVIVTDCTVTGLAIERGYKEIAETEGDLRFEFFNSETMNVRELVAALQALPEDDVVVVFGNWMRDRSSFYEDDSMVCRYILEQLSLPIYCVLRNHIGTGVIGGVVTSEALTGKAVANLVAETLEGSVPFEHGKVIEEDLNVVIFDHKPSQQWGLDLSQIDRPMQIINRPTDILDEYKWTFLAIIIFVGFQTTLMVVLIINRSRRIRAERKLMQNEQRLHFALEGADEGIWDWNLRTGQAFLSQRGTELLGYKPNDLPPNFDAWVKLIHPHDRAKFQQKLDQYLAGSSDLFEIEYRMQSHSGRWIWILTRGRAVDYDSKKQPLRMAGTHTDITGRKKMEAEILKAREDAEAANMAKSDFLANMSHEIRTPMTAILGYCDMLMHPKVTNEERAEHMRTIRDNGHLLLNIINDILDISRVEAGKMDLHVEAVSPWMLVNEVVSMVKLKARDKGLQLDVRYDFPIPHIIQTDVVRLKQVLLNLLSNAIKFTEKGRVTLLVRHMQSRTEEHQLMFVVSDTGVGMTSDQIARIFNPFTQADTSTTRRYGGTGLGLTIAKRMAELLGGDIEVESSPGRGSIFTFTIPVGDVEELKLLDALPQASAKKPRQAKGISGETIKAKVLIVEDTPPTQDLVQFFLSKVGIRSEVADNGQVAWERIKEATKNGDPFDLVLMDMQMPVLNGYECTRRLRRAGHKMPIIAMTAHTMSGDREKCVDAGCDDYIPKPIEIDDLLDRIRHYLSDKSQ